MEAYNIKRNRNNNNLAKSNSKISPNKNGDDAKIDPSNPQPSSHDVDMKGGS